MTKSYELTKLEPHSFEHLVNLLALKVLGAGHTGFGPGPDGGRDGYFEGEAPYPSEVDRWKGIWYIQSKFHAPNLSKDSQKWLLNEIESELKEFKDPESKRKWPDIWIVATNIDPSGAARTGTFDKAKKLVEKARPKLAKHFHIWGGQKILDLLGIHPEVSTFYKDFLTPGQIFTTLFEDLSDSRAELQDVLHFLIVRQFNEQQYTKLEQAGSDADTRPGIHKLYIDLPFHSHEYELDGMVTEYMVRASGKCQRVESTQIMNNEWHKWCKHPSRARVWFLKGGPGQGKSTVGQFFCQVQRAALILQDDCFHVHSKAKALAEDVRDIAKQAGYWPEVPRIPISLELRDYAQWYGQKDKQVARGILTYLSERLTAGVEQQVHVGLLRRALSSRSWFVTFDGLDEVPHDVKDGVALEVMNFLNDTMIETKSDLFALCTSRPQGYSGQFSDLDGPTIDLVNLTPVQALRCAKPVLILGRTEDEAKKYLQILESAIDSSSVKELMTSPLQSHIMAIVIRDGGRPPERRWQLYSNFYQVIKRREANRDLPDKLLAKLLREDTQLLKVVHNTLGYILHARAETSKGAQSRLEKSEFRTILVKVVSQMIEQEPINTINVLMDATTNRLVLVNTPDDGDHLRFDIRPLQEFFAAEFLYETVGAEELRKRLELIGGDAHWREVMHFLLSALVENNRHTELAVAVEVLDRLNDGSGDTNDRLLRRRIARGTLLAGRLLQEGVLEQDKRVRQQFRKSLEPLGALLDESVLKPLADIRAQNSRSWFTTFLLETLREADRTENIGAAILLAQVLEDSDSRVEEVKKYFDESPAEYVVAILDSLNDSIGISDKKNEIKKWMLEIVIKLLISNDWKKFGDKGITEGIRLLKNCLGNTISLTSLMDLRPVQRKLLEFIIREDGGEKLRKDKPTDYGLVTVSYYECDWVNDRHEEIKWWPISEEDQKELHGILQLACRILAFSWNKTLGNFKLISEYVNNDLAILEALPRAVRVLAPIEVISYLESQGQDISSLTEAQFKSVLLEQKLGDQKIPRPRHHVEIKSVYELNKWMQLINDFTDLALFFYSDEQRFGRKMKGIEEILHQQTAIDLLVDKIIQNPVIFLYYPYIWGKLLDQAHQKRDKLITAIRSACKGKVKQFWRWRQEEFYSMKLDFPQDGVLLPHLANAIIEFYSQPIRENDPADFLKMVEIKINEMVDNVNLLEAIIKEPKTNNSERVGAIVLTLLHPDGHVKFKELGQILARSYEPGIGRWYFRAITFCISLFGSEQDEISKSIISDLLDKSRNDYSGRNELQEILLKWRETSYAPIESAGVLLKWLD